MRITGLYAALCALIVVVLAVRVSMARRDAKVSLGDGGDRVLVRRIRAHGNAVEYVPLALLLLLLLELDQTEPWLLHAFGCVLVAARIAHAIGVSQSSANSAGRAIGAGLTWLVMIAMAVLLLWQVIGGWVIAQGV